MTVAGPNETGAGLIQENGVIVYAAASTTPITFNVTTVNHGSFSFSPSNFTFGGSTTFLAGKALVELTGSPTN